MLVGFLKANRSRWSKKKIRPQRGALNEGSRPADRLLMKYSCKEWLYLSIHPSCPQPSHTSFFCPPPFYGALHLRRKKKIRKQALFHWHHKDELNLYLIIRNPQRIERCMVWFQAFFSKLLLFGRSSVCLGKCSQHMTTNCTFTSAACMGNISFITIP